MNTFAHISTRALCIAAFALTHTQALAQSSKPAEASGESESMNETHVRAFLLHETGSIKPGETTTLALHFVIDPEWHMYWNGYAEDGMEPNWELQLPEGIEVAGEVIWPIPHRSQPSEFVVEHVFEHTLTLLIPMRVADTVPAGEAKLGVKAKWLVCSDRCVPESGKDAITLRVGTDSAPKSPSVPAKADHSSRPSQSDAAKLIENARRDLGRLQPLTGPRAKELGITATITHATDAATLQLRANDNATALTWFPANKCAHPSSDFAAWTAEGNSLDIPLAADTKSSDSSASDSKPLGKTPETARNHSNSVCVRGILQVKTRDTTHNASEYFVVQVEADAGK